LENRGPMETYSMRRSMSSRITTLRGVLYALSKTFDISCIFPFSVYPTYFSGVIILAYENPLFYAIYAAIAVFPDPSGPSNRIDIRGESSFSRTWLTSELHVLIIS
jgi:hypothetical protein